VLPKSQLIDSFRDSAANALSCPLISAHLALLSRHSSASFPADHLNDRTLLAPDPKPKAPVISFPEQFYVDSMTRLTRLGDLNSRRLLVRLRISGSSQKRAGAKYRQPAKPFAQQP